jgi:hypothetical protein
MEKEGATAAPSFSFVRSFLRVLFAYANVRQVADQPKDLKQPEHYDNDYNAIQNGLDS